jgi:hypothetical protein
MRAEALERKKQSVLEQTSNSFNILNHTGPPRKIDSERQTMKTMRPSREYNVLTNMKHEDHEIAPLLYSPEFANLSIKKHAPPRPEPRGKIRDFNVISNQFTTENAEEMRLAEYNGMKDHLLKKYWQSRDYDAITGQFVDDEKQRIFEQQRKAIAAAQGAASLLKLPPSIKYSDGNSYNIMNHSVYDDKQFKATNTVASKSINKIKRIAIESKWKEEGEISGDVAEARRLNRVSYSRFSEQLNRGFDPIKSEQASEDYHPYLPAPHRPPTHWARLTTDTTNAALMPARTVATRNLAGSSGGLFHHSEDSPQQQQQQQRSSNAAVTAPPLGSSLVGLEAPDSFIASTTARNYRSSGQSSGRQEQQSARRAFTADPYAAAAGGNSSGRQLSSGGAVANVTLTRSIPSLELNRTLPAEEVRYVEPQSGGPRGQPVLMVRTGGLSSYRN